MFVISLNHKKSKTEYRERLSFDDSQILELLNKLKAVGINQGVYVCTCNRCELYGIGKAAKALGILAELACVDKDELKDQTLFFEGEGAINHLFHVTAGFDSMVLGEDEILRQIKNAYLYSKDNGYTDYELNTIFQGAICCAKKIKTKTKLSKTSTSIASLAATKIHNYKHGIKKVMIIGATGDTGNKVMLNLLSYGDCQIYTTKHISHINNSQVKIIPYADRYEYIGQMDVVVSATKSPHYTVTYGKLKNSAKEKDSRLFIDLAVPRDIDEDITSLSGNQLISIDDFEVIARENNSLKFQEKENGELILEDELNSLLKELIFHKNRESLERLSDIDENNLIKFVYKYRKIASSEEFKSFVNVINKMQEV